MDRNSKGGLLASVSSVALRKESVDRNAYVSYKPYSDGLVALRKESVDRNDVIRPAIDVFLAVALRKESVDRNLMMV